MTDDEITKLLKDLRDTLRLVNDDLQNQINQIKLKVDKMYGRLK